MLNTRIAQEPAVYLQYRECTDGEAMSEAREVDSAGSEALCQGCFHVQGRRIVLSQVQGFALWFSTEKFEGFLCANCAEERYFQMQSKTLTLGWWAVPVGTILTIGVAGQNLREIQAHRQADADASQRKFRHARKSKGVRISSGLLIGLLAIFMVDAASGADRDELGNIANSGKIRFESLRTGDCFISEALASRDEVPEEVKAVPCSEAHQFELYFLGSIPFEQFPDYIEDEVSAYAAAQCQVAFEAYVGISYQSSSLKSTHVYPSAASWAFGDTKFECLVSSADGSEIAHSFRDSRT